MRTTIVNGLERAATVFVTAAAIAVGIAALHREFGAQRAGGGVTGFAPPALARDWQVLTQYGRWLGDSAAPVKIVEFGDYECPFCRQFNETYIAARRIAGRDVALLFIDFPLAQHRFAVPAALVAQCADSLGRFGQIHDILFAKQDSFGLKSWQSYAAEAGVSDTTAFEECFAHAKLSARTEQGIAVAHQFKIRATPTIFINGWRYAVAPYDSLDRIISRFRRTTVATRVR